MSAREKEFKKDASSQAKRWLMEIEAAKDEVRKFHDVGERVIARFRDERDATNRRESRVCLFSSSVITLRAMLFGRIPQVSVDRRWSDSQDDVARVAAEMLERMLNLDIEADDSTDTEAFGHALDDWLLPGMGCVRVRYEIGETVSEPAQEAKYGPDGKETAPAVGPMERRPNERVEVDYCHWRDVLWSAGARTPQERRWQAYRVQMSRRQLVKRFGAEVGNSVPLGSKKAKGDQDAKKSDPWDRADVWEIYDKEDRQVVWFAEGAKKVLETKPDALNLAGFFPYPRSLSANLTTSSLIPCPDFRLTQDLDDEINTLSTRARLLAEVIKAAGGYDKDQPGLRQLVDARAENILVPMAKWGAFTEKGGMRGSVDFLPVDIFAMALDKLTARVSMLIALRDQVAGTSDIQRGQSSSPGTTATEQNIKAQWGSVRVQSRKDEFARFVTDTQKLKAEIISKHFDPQTIIERSNVLRTNNAQHAQAAAELIKSDFGRFRIQVKPENLALADFSQMRQEKLEVMDMLGRFIQVVAPATQTLGPTSLPFMLELGQESLAGVKGAEGVEAVFDEAVKAAKAQAQQPQPQQEDPKLAQIKAKTQADMQRDAQKHQLEIQKIGIEVQADAAREQNQEQSNVREHLQKQQITSALRPPPTVSVKPKLGGAKS